LIEQGLTSHVFLALFVR